MTFYPKRQTPCSHPRGQSPLRNKKSLYLPSRSHLRPIWTATSLTTGCLTTGGVAWRGQGEPARASLTRSSPDIPAKPHEAELIFAS